MLPKGLAGLGNEAREGVGPGTQVGLEAKEIGVEANYSPFVQEGFPPSWETFPLAIGQRVDIGHPLLPPYGWPRERKRSPRGLTQKATVLSPSFLAQCWPRLQLLLWALPPPPTTPSKAVVSGV